MKKTEEVNEEISIPFKDDKGELVPYLNKIKKRISDLFPKAIYEIPKENKQKTREEVYSQ